MNAKETLYQLIVGIIGSIYFLSKEQQEQYIFIMIRLDDLEKNEQTMLKIKSAIAESEGEI